MSKTKDSGSYKAQDKIIKQTGQVEVKHTVKIQRPFF